MVVRSANDLIDYDPMLWGPPGWKFLHFVSFCYPNRPTRKHKRQFSDFFASIGNVLPCKTCRMHYQRGLRAAIRDSHGHFDFLESRETLAKWLIDLHNAVNANNSKPPVEYETIKHQYETSANLCTSPSKTGSYTNLLESRGYVEESSDDLLFQSPGGGLTRQEIIIAAVVLLVIVTACAVALRYTCTSCAK